MRPADPCPICDGTEWSERMGEGGERRVARCSCWYARRTRERLAAAGIPLKYQHATFETFHAYNESLTAACRLTREWADGYPVIPRRAGDRAGRGLVLHGVAGVGKTHLAAVLLRQVITATGCSGLFVTTKDLLWSIRQSYNPAIQATEAAILTPILTCDVLVLDDLGEERFTDWVAETMSLVINTRYTTHRPVIATTNYADSDDDQDLNGLLARLGFRVLSRLREMCEFVAMTGADYRQLPPNGTVEDLRQVAPTARAPHLVPVRASLRSMPGVPDGRVDVKWPGGRGGNV